jgi:hypothetical protein
LPPWTRVHGVDGECSSTVEVLAAAVAAAASAPLSFASAMGLLVVLPALPVANRRHFTVFQPCHPPHTWRRGVQWAEAPGLHRGCRRRLPQWATRQVVDACCFSRVWARAQIFVVMMMRGALVPAPLPSTCTSRHSARRCTACPGKADQKCRARQWIGRMCLCLGRLCARHR